MRREKEGEGEDEERGRGEGWGENVTEESERGEVRVKRKVSELFCLFNLEVTWNYMILFVKSTHQC